MNRRSFFGGLLGLAWPMTHTEVPANEVQADLTVNDLPKVQQEIEAAYRGCMTANEIRRFERIISHS